MHIRRDLSHTAMDWRHTGIETTFAQASLNADVRT